MDTPISFETGQEIDWGFVKSMAPADRLIYFLREAIRTGIPDTHYEELFNTTLQAARHETHKGKVAGLAFIKERQRDIVRNLREQIVGNAEYLVLDVGAADGWFLSHFIDADFRGEIIAFEPQRIHRAALNSMALEDRRIHYEECALGDEKGELTLQVFDNEPGISSLLPLNNGYHFFSDSFNQGDQHQELVGCTTIDSFLTENTGLDGYSNVALKVDVQGFEKQVLKGANETIASGRIRAIMLEMSTIEKYKGAPGYLELFNYMEALGFRLYDLLPFYREIEMEFQERARGHLTEFDCIFVRSEDPTLCPKRL